MNAVSFVSCAKRTVDLKSKVGYHPDNPHQNPGNEQMVMRINVIRGGAATGDYANYPDDCQTGVVEEKLLKAFGPGQIVKDDLGVLDALLSAGVYEYKVTSLGKDL